MRTLPLLTTLLVFGSALQADPDESAGFKLLRHEEVHQDSFVLGGELRTQFEHYTNLEFDTDPAFTDGYLLYRLMLHADARFAEGVRGFLQLQSGLSSELELPPSPVDENDLAVHEAFLDLQLTASLLLRPGRQELSYGSGRLLSVREGPNIRRSFDGIKAIWKRADLRIDAFVMRPVDKQPDVFDDPTEDDRTLWGIYAVLPRQGGGGSGIDAYYIGQRHDDVRFDRGQGDEVRHSVGTRWWGSTGRFRYNAEGIVQFGRFAGQDLRAWTGTVDLGYELEQAVGRPVLDLKVSAVSGDRPDEGRLGTFNALFPRGNYFGESALIGPSNLYTVHPGVAWTPAKETSVALCWDFFWRESTDDGIYGPAGPLVVSGRSSQSRFVGSELSILFERRITRHLSAAASASRFFAETFLEQSGRGNDVDYVMGHLSFKF